MLRPRSAGKADTGGNADFRRFRPANAALIIETAVQLV
jgi:hypothetical protein